MGEKCARIAQRNTRNKEECLNIRVFNIQGGNGSIEKISLANDCEKQKYDRRINNRKENIGKYR